MIAAKKLQDQISVCWSCQMAKTRTCLVEYFLFNAKYCHWYKVGQRVAMLRHGCFEFGAGKDGRQQYGRPTCLDESLSEKKTAILWSLDFTLVFYLLGG